MKKPDFGPMFIESPNGCLIENPQRERNAISYLLDILEVKKRGEYITGIDGGPGMDSDAMIAKIKNLTDEDLVKMALSHFINGGTSKLADYLIIHFPRRVDEAMCYIGNYVGS